MHLPKIYQYFSDNFPDIIHVYNRLDAACRKSGPLDPKAQNLVNLGIAIGVSSRGAIMSQTRKALEAGATRGEIHHAVLLGLTTIGFPKMMAAMGWVNEVLEKELAE